MKGRATYLVVIAALLAAATGAALVLSDAGKPEEMTNPGKFTGVAGPGSIYQYVDAEGNPIPLASFDAGRPSCADTVDNDLDQRVDGDDPECDGDLDANERLDGVQPYLPSSLPVKIKANGVITLRPTDLQVQPAEKCIQNGDEVWCVLVSPRGAGPARRGRVDGDRVTLPIPLTVKFDAVTGYPGFDPRCEVGYTENVYVDEDYDRKTGVAVLEIGDDNPAPAARNCGDWTSALNSALGLPGAARSKLIVTLRNDAGDAPGFE